MLASWSRSEEIFGALCQRLARKTPFAGYPRGCDARGLPAAGCFSVCGLPAPNLGGDSIIKAAGCTFEDNQQVEQLLFEQAERAGR